MKEVDFHGARTLRSNLIFFLGAALVAVGVFALDSSSPSRQRDNLAISDSLSAPTLVESETAAGIKDRPQSEEVEPSKERRFYFSLARLIAKTSLINAVSSENVTRLFVPAGCDLSAERIRDVEYIFREKSDILAQMCADLRATESRIFSEKFSNGQFETIPTSRAIGDLPATALTSAIGGSDNDVLRVSIKDTSECVKIARIHVGEFLEVDQAYDQIAEATKALVIEIREFLDSSS